MTTGSFRFRDFLFFFSLFVELDSEGYHRVIIDDIAVSKMAVKIIIE